MFGNQGKSTPGGHLDEHSASAMRLAKSRRKRLERNSRSIALTGNLTKRGIQICWDEKLVKSKLIRQEDPYINLIQLDGGVGSTFADAPISSDANHPTILWLSAASGPYTLGSTFVEISSIWLIV